MHLIVSRDHKDPKTCLDNMITSRKLEKEFKFHQKMAKSGVITKVITILLALKTLQQIIINPSRRSLQPWCQKNNQKDKLKIAIF